MAVQQPVVSNSTADSLDPRYPLVAGFAFLCILAFYLSAVHYYYYGSYLEPLLATSRFFSGLATLDFGEVFNFITLTLLAFPAMILLRGLAWFRHEGKRSFAGNVFNDSGTRNFFFEMLLLGLLGFFFWFVVGNAVRNLAAANIASGFGFLEREAGFGINFSPFVVYSETSNYSRVFLVGLQNTLLISILGIVFATLLGFIVGVARLSTNWVISRVAYVFVEIMRNIPLLLWIFIWYFSVLRLLPQPRDSINLGVFGFLNIRGLSMPKPLFEPGSMWIAIAFIAAIAATLAIARWARIRQMATGQQFPVLWTAIGLIVGLPVLAYLATGMPVAFDRPQLSTFGARGGTSIPPEFLGLLLALTTYTSSYIAEIVRAGILAVSKGQTEASFALGLRPGPTLRLVIIPQAMRVIIPPMTNQYLNLTKNSSLAVAIAYPDLVSVFAGTALNQTGQAVEILLTTMLTYLALSLLTSMFMNWYNARMALVER
jgi:general L-amino acid transport system permease protein